MPQSLWLGVGVVFAGSACAVMRGNLEVLPATICLLFACFTQLYAGFFTAYVDMKSRDVYRVPAYIASDPRQIDDYSIRVMREFSNATLILSLMCGLALMTISKVWYWEVILGAVIYGLIFLHTLGRKPLIRTPWGMILTFLLFGPIGVIGTSLLQSSKEAMGTIWSHYDLFPSFFVGPAMGFLAVTVHLMFAYTAHLVEPNKKRFALERKLRRKWVQFYIFMCGLLMLALMVWMVMSIKLPMPAVALVAPFIGFTLNTSIAFSLKNGNMARLHHLSLMAIANYAITAIVLFVCLLTIAPADDSF